jgi:hypothetical protein
MRSFFSFSHFNAMQSTYAPQRQPQSLIALSAASWDGCWAEFICSGVKENLLPPLPKKQTVCGNLQALGHHHATKLQPSHFSADGLWQDDDF